MTEEEKKVFFKARRQKQIEALNKKKEESKLLDSRLLQLRQEIIQEKNDHFVHDLMLMSDPKHKPEIKTIWKFYDLLERGLPPEQIRVEMGAEEIPDETWNSFKKYLFSRRISSPEDMGLNLIQVRLAARDRIKEQVEHMKEMQKKYPKEYHRDILMAEKSIFEIEKDMADILHKIGAVGEKNKTGTQIVVVNNIPRPGEGARVVDGDSIRLQTESDAG